MRTHGRRHRRWETGSPARPGPGPVWRPRRSSSWRRWPCCRRVRRSAQGFEAIPAIDVDIAIESNGDIVVTEVIDYDFGAADRHGIFRDIPVRFHYDSQYDRIYPLDVISVQGSPGTPDEYEESTSGGDKVLKIGDPDRTISGPHTYTLRYRVRGALNAFDEHDELYWNAIGDEWPVPVEKATVQVRAPGPISDVTCFAGPVGSNLPCETAEASGDVATFTAGPVDNGDAITVVVGFPKGLVAAPTPVLDERWTFSRAFAVTPVTAGLSAAMLAGAVALVGALIWRTGRDRRYSGSHVDVAFGSETGTEQAVPIMERPITPVEFEPPDKLRPGQVGTLWDEVANPLDVTATIIDLAVRGYLRIDEIAKQGWFGKPDWNAGQAQGRRQAEALRGRALQRPVRGPRPGEAVRPEEHLRHGAEEGPGRALRGRCRAGVVPRPARQDPHQVAGPRRPGRRGGNRDRRPARRLHPRRACWASRW